MTTKTPTEKRARPGQRLFSMWIDKDLYDEFTSYAEAVETSKTRVVRNHITRLTRKAIREGVIEGGFPT